MSPSQNANLQAPKRETRIGNIIIGYDSKENPVYCRDIKAQGAMTALLKDAFNPNLVQTLEHTPALIHGGPFANIAHGCNSLVATKLGLSLADYVVTEAGFGADLGAEKFLDIKCQIGDLKPNAIIIVATTKALKYNGGVPKDEVNKPNLNRHIENMVSYGVPVIVCLNHFNTDKATEINWVIGNTKAPCVCCSSFADGGSGAKALAWEVLDILEDEIDLVRPYDLNDDIKDKILKLSENIYRTKYVEYSFEALEMIKKIQNMGFSNLPICMAKTQYSFSDNPNALCAPNNFTINVNEVRLCAGAGFIVVICGKIMTMPGLPKHPAAENIDVSNDGLIEGLF